MRRVRRGVRGKERRKMRRWARRMRRGRGVGRGGEWVDGGVWGLRSRWAVWGGSEGPAMTAARGRLWVVGDP